MTMSSDYLSVIIPTQADYSRADKFIWRRQISLGLSWKETLSTHRMKSVHSVNIHSEMSLIG